MVWIIDRFWNKLQIYVQFIHKLKTEFKTWLQYPSTVFTRLTSQTSNQTSAEDTSEQEVDVRVM